MRKPLFLHVVAATAVVTTFHAAHNPSVAGTPSAADAGGGPAVIGEPRPGLELDLIDGSLVNDARTAGRPLIVEFFATWCQPCHKALADMTEARRAASKVAGPQVRLLLVDLGEPVGVVKRWVASAHLPDDAIVAVDPDGIAARRWGARRLPTTFIIDARGVVRHINRGWGAGYRDRVLRWLRTIDAAAGSGAPVYAPP